MSEGPELKLARRIIDAVITSPCVVETRFFSQPQEQEKLETQIAAMLATYTADLATCTVEERAVIDKAMWWHAEVNRTRSTSAFHVTLEGFERELFEAGSALLAARAKAGNVNDSPAATTPKAGYYDFASAFIVRQYGPCPQPDTDPEGEERWHARLGLVAQAVGEYELLAARPDIDARLDRAYIAGAEFGWNCGVEGANERFNATIRQRYKNIQEANGGDPNYTIPVIVEGE